MISHYNIDPFRVNPSYTKQTELILRNVGAGSLLKECQKRNISSNELHMLTKQDFIHLGADENLAEKLLNRLKIASKNNLHIKLVMQNKFEDVIKMIENNNKQLNFIDMYINYIRLKLMKTKKNFYIEVDELLTVASVLYIGVTETLLEVDDMEKAIKELYALVPKDDKPKKTKRFIYFSALFTGLGLVICLALRIRKV
ncbi:uncharacterized protein LOC124954295 [Vespa velutina]|uniref:uncharacterized protein LOC124954295 n=1 Tax=Vespa velutina TaxID=202808 RepID=UPI001FB4531F|nr:uncharacterized protein LOC124954295 [Vespa velutina]